MYVYVHGYVYPYIFIKIIQARKTSGGDRVKLPESQANLGQVAWALVQLSVEPLQVWRPHSLSGHLF